MNYYEHHIGDYAEATGHLSFVEDAAYSRMIRKYYATEKPLPADAKAIQRLIGARTKEEKEAVETVLQEFFTLQDDGWHNKRCDEVIERYREKSGKARASAQARWTKTTSAGNANALQNTMPSDSQRNANASETHDGRNALQSPIASNQSPAAEQPEPRAADVSKLPIAPEAAMAIPLREQNVDVTSMHPTLLAWVKDGFTLDQVLEALAIAKKRKGEDERISPNYIDAILRNPGKQASPAKAAPVAQARRFPS